MPTHYTSQTGLCAALTTYFPDAADKVTDTRSTYKHYSVFTLARYFIDINEFIEEGETMNIGLFRGRHLDARTDRYSDRPLKYIQSSANYISIFFRSKDT